MNSLVLEESEFGIEPVSVYSKLAENRILFISNMITEELAGDIVATLLLQFEEDQNKNISMFINANGADIRDTFMIYDMINMLGVPIETICVGEANDGAALLLAAGAKGKRYATENAMISIAQLNEGSYDLTNLTEAKATLDRLKVDNKNFITAIAKNVGKNYSEVLGDLEKRKYFSAKQAKAYGLIDHIVG